ncbi:MAG: hypothetical protein LBU27_03900 [Candidatus Peribacteria bacterium]|jgi:hypothetical protein|nr:hypothetical protein [Candidatus Peribacteria bacterium]
MIYKDEATSFIKNIVIKILVAGVCIQISRFLTAAILDVSTIATAAVGTIPSHVITLNTDLTKAITHITKQIEAENGEINRQITRTIDLTETSAKKVEYSTQPINSTLSISGVIDLLTPNANSFAGPLVYLGINMLNESQLPNMDMTQPLSSLIKILFSGIEIILYSLAMILLCVIAFMRIVYLRLFIILSPIIILLYCISAVGKQKLKEIDGITDALKQKGFSVQGFLNLAFKPVIICLALSLALIFSGLMRPLIDQHSDSLESNGVTVTSKEELTNNAQGEGGKTYTTTLDTNMVNVAIRGVNKTLQELLLSIITLVLMWFIIKIAIAQKTGI